MLAKYIWKGMRPATLLVGLSPVLLGTILGMNEILESGQQISRSHILLGLLALILVVLMQGAANLVNDVKDAESGVDTGGRTGPLRIVASGLVKASTVRWSYRLFFLVTLLSSAYLAIHGGLQIFLLGIACCLFAFAYTGGPLPLSHLGLGELVAFVFFGPIAVAGSALLQIQRWSLDILILGAGPGLLAAAIMAVNNHRDRQSDLSAGKRTLATRLRPEMSQSLPWLFILIAISISIIPYLEGNKSSPWKILLPVGLLFLAQKMVKKGLSGDAQSLNATLKRIAQFELIYTASLIAAVLL